MLEEYTDLYSVQKTLRFELIPIGKTLEHIERRGILETDTKLAESYEKMKETIDEFHKDFIDGALTGMKLTGLSDFHALYTAGAEEKKKDDYRKKYEKVRSDLRKEIAGCFRSQSLFRNLDKKELIQKELGKWIDAKRPDLYNDKDFYNFTSYFTGYHTSRMNMYSDEEKATSIAHRLIDENLPKFIDNMGVFAKVRIALGDDVLDRVYRDMEPWLNVRAVEELFTLEAYSGILTQTQIDAYNGLIGGRTTEGGQKLQGLNEYINLHNQTHPEKKLPLFKPLFKQILSERNTASWLPEAFADEEELIENVSAFHNGSLLKGGEEEQGILDRLKACFDGLASRDLKCVYLSEKSFSGLSNTLFGYYGTIADALGIDPDPESKRKEKYYPIHQTQEALNEYAGEREDEQYADFFKGYSETCIVDHFRGIHPLEAAITAAYADAEPYFCAEKLLTPEGKEKLKAYMDSVLTLLHFVKPLYLSSDEALQKDEVFYGSFLPAYDDLQKFTRLYDKVRNFATKKPYSTEKVKLNFDSSTLLNGWDVNKEEQNLGVLLIKDGKYYLGIMDKKSNKAFSKITAGSGSDCYQKVMYKLLPGPNKMLPKVFFSKSRIGEFSPDSNILRIRDSETFKKGPNFSLEDCHAIIDFYKASIEKHPEWNQFEFQFSPTEQYADISEFYREVSNQGYKLTYKPISASYIDSLVSDGKLYLFQIYSKDFSPHSKGKPNLHTMYWRALFDEKNLADVVYKLNGEAEMFYRKSSIRKENRITHKAGQPLDKKNPNSAGQSSRFDYDITKDRRYTVDKFQLHVPITLNFKAAGSPRINDSVCAYLKNNPDVNVIGIDRGERHLLYLSMIDRSGKVVKDKNGKYIQYSLNTVTGEYRDRDGQTVKFSTPYRELLEKKEKEREEARESWGTIENIKELKAGYLSQVVHHIAGLMVEYNAIVVLEDLNGGFKNGRKKVEKRVYQNFEKALIEKLNYLVLKDRLPDEVGGLYHALQLTDEFKSFAELKKQSGFLFYVPAWNTSKIDPVTGFVDLLKPKYVNVRESKRFFGKFRSIRYDPAKDWFEFSFDYSDFTDKANGSRLDWTVCTVGDLRFAFNSRTRVTEKLNVTAELKSLLEGADIGYRSGADLRDAITAQESAGFFARLTKLLRVTLAMRYSGSENGRDFDFILSPVADSRGEFYCSEGRTDGLPQDADANGAYNIARKGLMVLERIDKAEKSSDWTTKIKNSEWLRFVQRECGD